jgi:uncharacterized membrane protein
MNTKTFLIGFVAALAILMIGFASAGDLIYTSTLSTTFNDVVLGSGVTMAGITGEYVPVRTTFRANDDAEDVRVKVWMDGHRDNIEDETSRFDLVAGSTYTKLLQLSLPDDLKDTTKEFTLHVSISNSNGYDSTEYTVRMQRESYNFDVLSMDYPNTVAGGDIVPVSVVIENIGMQDLENGYVIVSIDELGVSAKGFFGDLVAVEDCSDDCDDEDSVQKTVYIKVPQNTEAGVYTINAEVYNKDARTVATGLIRVDGSASTTVIAGMKSQDMKAGETKTFDLIVVNSGDDVGIYNIQTVSGSNLEVSAPSVVTVGPDSSSTVPVTVTVSRDADVGAYTFTVDVNGEQVVFGANVTGSSVSTSVVALTVILVIIFLVLLVVLIVLLTRREQPVEEVETSYY